MAELLFYKKPVVLNRDAHRKLRFKPVIDFSFSKDVNSVPLLAVEFFEASRDLPVLFSKDDKGQYFPIVLMSMRNDGHDLVGAKGVWLGQYTPAFVRRYPFALTDNKDLCFDSEYKGLSEKGKGDLLFDEDEGKNTEQLDKVIAFLQNFDAEHARTRDFCAAVAEKDLFKPFVLQVMTPDNKPLRMEGLHIVDEQKMNALEDAEVTDWFRKGYLAWAYGHLHSLGAIKRLAEQLNTKQ